jgi:hypothetical protein
MSLPCASSNYRIRAIEPADENSAIVEAAKQFNITPARRNKIVVTRMQAAEKRAVDSSD